MLATGEGVTPLVGPLADHILGRDKPARGPVTARAEGLLADEDADESGFPPGREGEIGRHYAERWLREFAAVAGPGAFNNPINDFAFRMGAIVRLGRMTHAGAEQWVLEALADAGGGDDQHEETARRALAAGIGEGSQERPGAGDHFGGGAPLGAVWGVSVAAAQTAAPAAPPFANPFAAAVVQGLAPSGAPELWVPGPGATGEENDRMNREIWTAMSAREQQPIVVAWHSPYENQSAATVLLALEERGAILWKGGLLLGVTQRGGRLSLVDLGSRDGRQFLLNLCHERLEIVTTIRASAGDCVGCWRAAGGCVMLNVGRPKRGATIPEGATLDAAGHLWQPTRLLRDAAPPDRRARLAFYPDDEPLREGSHLVGVIRGREDATIAAGVGDLILVTGRIRPGDRGFEAQMRAVGLAATGHGYQMRGILRAPSMAPDGRILCARGYDRGSGYWLVPDDRMPVDFSAMPRTIEAARAASDYLLGFIAGAAFADPIGRWAAVGFIIAGIIRPAWGHAPVGLVISPIPGTGKGTLISIITRAAYGADGSIAALSWSDATSDEMSKAFATELMRSPDVVTIDNVPGHIPNIPLLLSAVTEDAIDVRRLGASESARVETRGLLTLVNGNNVTLGSDWPRRVITISLILPEPEVVEEPIPESEWAPMQRLAATFGTIPTRRVERPAGGLVRDRSRDDLMRWIDEERPKIVAAALTIAAWGVEARRDGSIRWPKARDSFEDFSRLVRDPLWLLTGGESGGVDILTPTETVEVEDTRAGLDGDLLSALWAVVEGEPGWKGGVTLADVRSLYDRVAEPGWSAPGAGVPMPGAVARHPVLKLTDVLDRCVGAGASEQRRWITLSARAAALQNQTLDGVRLVRVRRDRANRTVWTMRKVGAA
ncbi:hypothetical protein J3S89_02920 [Pinisolibacter sp. B13]|nr:hypothetical protein [Pinisolibacter aquiterrae]